MTRMKRKRAHSFNASEEYERKWPRTVASPTISTGSADMLSLLSDEILIRILKHLPVETVLLCQSISKRWGALSTDGEVWRSLFWTRFVQPNLKKKGFKYTIENREEKWINEQKKKRQEGIYTSLGQDAKDKAPRIDWKARYRLRHNWSRGAADVREIGLQEEMDTTTGQADETRKMADPGRLVARIADGRVVTVDQTFGIRAWDLRKDDGSSECTAHTPFTPFSDNGGLVPTTLALDSTSETDTRVAVGFEDGGFAIWRLHIGSGEQRERFSPIYMRLGPGEEGVALAAIAYAHPHLLTVTEEQVLSLYVLEDKSTPGAVDGDGPSSGSQDTLREGASEKAFASVEAAFKIKAPRLLTSLKSHTSWPPLSLSIRSTPQAIIASIAYALPTYTTGWSVGLQELHISHNGTISRSRLASAAEQGFHSLLSPSSSVPPSPSLLPRRTQTIDDRVPLNASRPTSVSYSHPYLLASHPDNTLSLYLVTSTQDDLHISKARTLWGHTSSVSGAHVGERGKAVSISAQGEELRVWELERGLASKRMAQDEGVRVRSDAHDGMIFDNVCPPSRSKDNWVGFDEEVVIVLKESGNGAKALVVYDFT